MDATRATTLGRMVRRHWWLLCVGVVVGLGCGALALAVNRPVYASSTSVLVLPIGDTEVNLQTEAQLARSTQTAADAATLLAQSLPTAAPDDIDHVRGADVEVLPNTSVLLIRYEARTPEAARLGARSFAEAYLANRAAAARATLDGQWAALTGRITGFDAQVAAVNTRIAQQPANSPELASLRVTLTGLTSQVTALTTKANELAATAVNAGRIIKEPELPTQPVRPDSWLYLGTAGCAGALIGLLTAIARERLSRRVNDGADITRRDGIPLLADLVTEQGGSRPAVLSSKEPGGRAFNRLRNEVVASLGGDDQVILVTGASPGGASTVVAANLAAALARADNHVILVGANVAEFGADAVTLSQIFDVADIPGLTDVLTGRASLPQALQRAARAPRLHIVTPGGTASASGLLQSEGVRNALQALRRQARYVVVEAPSAASGADAQSLAGAADAAILVVEAGRARHVQVVDAAIQMRLVGTRLLGAIVLPRVVPQLDEPEPFRPMHRAEDAREQIWVQDNTRRAVEEPTAVLELLRQQTEVSADTQAQVQN
jgi:Mrp family chromosome partitioning ATPase